MFVQRFDIKETCLYTLNVRSRTSFFMFLQKKNTLRRSWRMGIMQMVYIFLPISFFGGIGWFADTLRGSKPLFLLIGIGLAFFITNILFYFQFRTLSSEMDKISSENLKKKENISDQSH